jgi:diaminohydroxyphosphoribosylaminopyrimidine deaminase/5-amino-6-(5-phosphoribosylamino)uracil reductase
MIDNVDAAKTEASSRLAVCVAPKIIGTGIEAVLGIRELIRPLIITDTLVTPSGVELILEGRVEYPDGPADGR